MPEPEGSAPALAAPGPPVSRARFIHAWAFIAPPSFLILPILFSGKMLYGADVVGVFHFSRIVIAEAFRAGRLPVWDPHVMAGFPLLAAVQGAVFYPPTWLCIAMPAGAFWTVSALLHMILSGYFAHAWLRRGLGVRESAALFGALVFMLSGHIMGRIYAGHVNFVWAYPWFAGLLWRLERFLAAPSLKRGVLMAVVLAMLVLAGAPQYVFFAGLLVAARLVHFVLLEREGRRERVKVAGRSAAWLALGFLFCAPQLLPTLELIGQMQRGTSEDEGFLTEYSLNPKDLTQLLFYPETSSPYFWETSGFIGGCAFLLAMAAFLGRHPQRHLWGTVAILGLLLALGSHVPFYPGFIVVVPGAGLFRGPGRYLLLFTVGVAALAGLGSEALWSRGRLVLGLAGGLLALLAFGQLFGTAWRHCRPQDARFLRWEPAVEADLRKRCGAEGRIASTGQGAPIEAIGRCQAAGLDQVCGYEPMMLQRYAELMNAARGALIGTRTPVLAAVGPHPVIDMLGARVWMSFGWRPGRNADSAQVQDNPNALPRAWLVNNAVVIESKEERLKRMARGPFDPRKTVILEELPNELPPVPSDSPGRAKVVSRRPGEYVIEVENDADAYLVLSEAYYPGWRAEVDGRSVDVVPANHLIQAVRLPPGKHVVRFSYRSRFLIAGMAIAALAATVPFAIVLVRRRRR
jgi:hypothetical protein